MFVHVLHVGVLILMCGVRFELAGVIESNYLAPPLCFAYVFGIFSLLYFCIVDMCVFAVIFLFYFCFSMFCVVDGI